MHSRYALIRYLGEDGKTWCVGSGLIVRDNVVLTADHVAVGSRHRVETTERTLAVKSVVRSGTDEVDLAVLWLDEPVLGLSQLRCARVDRTRPTKIDGCIVVGFPSWKRVGRKRVSAQVEGFVRTGEDLRTLAGGVDGQPLTLVGDRMPQEPDLLEGPVDYGHGKPWGGMSGAVVLAHDMAIGVIRSHRLSKGAHTLTVTPLTALRLLPAAKYPEFCEALGIDDVGQLVLLDGNGKTYMASNIAADHIFDSWLSELGSAITVPAPWQPSGAKDIPRWSLPLLTAQSPLTVVGGEMGSGKSRYIRQQLARQVNNVRAAGPVRRIVPLILEAEQLKTVMADSDPWAGAVRSFIAEHSASISIEERDRLADLLVGRSLSRSGDIGVMVACDGLDELPHSMLKGLLHQSSGPIVRFLRAEGASVVLGVRSGTDAERTVEAFAESVTDDKAKFVRVTALTRAELEALAQAWRVPLPPYRLDEFMTRHPTPLLAACALATDAIEKHDSGLLESMVRRLLAGEWKATAEIAKSRFDTALAAAAEVAFVMAAGQPEWRYSASATWVRRTVTTVTGGDEDVLAAVGRVLPRLLQMDAREVTWVHAAVQEFLVGWHLGNAVPQAVALEVLSRRWWQHAQWRRVTVHTAACTNDPAPLLGLLASDARNDPFAVLDQLLLECTKVTPVHERGKEDALARLRSQAKVMVPISRRMQYSAKSPQGGLKRVPELLRSLGADTFAGFVEADYLYPRSDREAKHHDEAGNPVKYRLSPLFLSALRAGTPVAVHLFRRCFGLLSPALPMAGFDVGEADEVVSAAAPWIETTELLVLNDPSREHPWINETAQLAIAEELWSRGAEAHISLLPASADIGTLMANLGAEGTGVLLSAPCSQSESDGRCRRLAVYAAEIIERSSTDHLNELLSEASITAPVRVAAALQLVRRGEFLAPGSVTRECVKEVVTHRCASPEQGRRQAVELLEGLLGDRHFGWAEGVLAEIASVPALLALARNNRRSTARTVFDRIFAEGNDYGLGLLPLLDIDIDLSESEVVEILKRTHHSGDAADKEDDDRIYRALRRLPRDARREVWNYAAPDGHVRMYVEAGYVIWGRMLHEVLSLDELQSAIRSASTMERAMQLLRAVLQISPPDARSLAAEIADKGWKEHITECHLHMSCRHFAGMSELFPSAIREQAAIHGEGLKLIASGRYNLIHEWRQPGRVFIAADNSHQSLARALATAAAHDTVGLEFLKEQALVDDDFEAALAEVNPMAGRSVMESRIISKAVVMDGNRAYRLMKLGSSLGIDWHVRAIGESAIDSMPFLSGTINSEVVLAVMHRLLREWASRDDVKSKANLAVAMYDVWHRWGEYLADENASEIRSALAFHAEDIAVSLVSCDYQG